MANRQAQEEKLQVKYYPIVLDGELLIMQISSFPSVRGFSSLGMICRGSNALALTKIQPGFRVQNINFSPPFQRKILIIAFVTGFWRTSIPKDWIWMNRESYILVTNWKGNTCWILFCVLPKQWIKLQFCAICIHHKEVYSWEDRLLFTLETARVVIFASVHHMWTKGNVISAINLCYQEAEKEVNRLSRYKRQLDNTNSRLESELEEARKLITARDQVSERMVMGLCLI